MTKRADDDLLDLPACVMKCDVCGHEPVDCWVKGFGCDACRGREAVLRASFGEAPERPS